MSLLYHYYYAIQHSNVSPFIFLYFAHKGHMDLCGCFLAIQLLDNYYVRQSTFAIYHYNSVISGYKLWFKHSFLELKISTTLPQTPKPFDQVKG